MHLFNLIERICLIWWVSSVRKDLIAPYINFWPDIRLWTLSTKFSFLDINITFITFMKRKVILKSIGRLFKTETSSQSWNSPGNAMSSPAIFGKTKIFSDGFHIWLEAFKKSFDCVNIQSMHQVLLTNTEFHWVNFELLLGKFSQSLTRLVIFWKVFLAMQ